MKKTYTWRTKPGSSAIMGRLLKFADQVDNRMDNKVCRITEYYPLGPNLKPEYHHIYKDEVLCQIKVLDIPEKEFLVFSSLLVDEPPFIAEE